MSKQPDESVIKAWVQLHRTHRILLESVEIALKSNEYPPLDWYDVLLELHRNKEGLRQFEISAKVLLNKHNLSRLIDRLEQDNLVTRFTCTEDGRGNLIKITQKGEKMLKKIWPVYSSAIQENFSVKLNSNDLVTLTRIMSKLTDQAKIN